MNNEKKSLVFFGSGPVAAESLRLLANTFSIEAVVTKPTTEREMHLACPESPVFLVSNKAELDRLIESRNFSSSCGVLIDFGIIVSRKIIDYFEFGIINSHFSLLPELRGADPISFAILEGKEKTGVSLMLLVEAMDEGPILSVGQLSLDGSETTHTLSSDLIELSYNLLLECLPKYLSGEINPVSQDVIARQFNLEASYTRKLTKSDGFIDWNKTAEQIEREIRAYIGWPKSSTSLNGIDCVITKAHSLELSGEPGELFINAKTLGVYCGHGALVIERLKPAGKNAMDSSSFLNGYINKLNI